MQDEMDIRVKRAPQDAVLGVPCFVRTLRAITTRFERLCTGINVFTIALEHDMYSQTPLLRPPMVPSMITTVNMIVSQIKVAGYGPVS